MEKRYKIPRREGWEQILEPLVKRITGAQQADVRAGCLYDCEVFFMQPYQLNQNCYCSYGQAKMRFDLSHKHTPQCFHTFLNEINEAFKKHPNYYKANIYRTERVNMVRQLCVRNGIKYDPKTVENVCTCPYAREWEALGLTHDPNCQKVLPNFWFKNNDVKIWWFKFFFRDAYSNQELTMDRFQELVSLCLNYVNSHTPKTLV